MNEKGGEFAKNNLGDYWDWDIFFDPLKDFKIENGVVHLWWVILKINPVEIETLSRILSPDEREKAQRFRFQNHRAIYILTRATIRKILARYLQMDAEDLRFDYNRFGKPYLAIPQRNQGLCFNLSHSHEVAMFAVANDRKLGVDVEWVDEGFDWEAVAEKYFLPHEICEIYDSAVNRRQELFLQYWTLKEAYTKAIGKGHSIPLNKVEIFQYGDRPEGLLGISVRGKTENGWSLSKVISPKGYVGALVAEGSKFEIKSMDYLLLH